MYLDFNATSPYSPRVAEYIKTQMLEDWANPSSEHDAGYRLKQRISDDRQVITEFLGCSTKQLYFTSGATESISTVLSPDTLDLNQIKTIITSNVEHHATLHRCEYLKKKGYEILYVDIKSSGQLDFEHLDKLCSENPKSLISLLWVNNETGVISDVQKIVEYSKKNDCKVHLDSVQALGKLPIDLDSIEIDFASFSGHKMGSLKGIGMLYAKNSKMIFPLVHGGGQESGVRPGTSNYPAIHSIRLAIEDVEWNKIEETRIFRDQFEKELLEKCPSFKVNGMESTRVGNTTNIYLGGTSSRAALLQLSREKIFVSTGSACSSGSIEPSHVITGMGFDKDYANSCMRLSLSSLDKKMKDELITNLSKFI